MCGCVLLKGWFTGLPTAVQQLKPAQPLRFMWFIDYGGLPFQAMGVEPDVLVLKRDVSIFEPTVDHVLLS